MFRTMYCVAGLVLVLVCACAGCGNSAKQNKATWTPAAAGMSRQQFFEAGMKAAAERKSSGWPPSTPGSGRPAANSAAPPAGQGQ